MTGRSDLTDVDREIDFHIHETVDALVASGMDERAARAEAERRFGDRRRHAHVMRSAHLECVPARQRLAAVWTDVVSEVRFAPRILRRSWSYSLTVVATLALASGANLTMFGIVDAMTYRPLNYLRSAHEVHRVYWQRTDNGQRATTMSTQYTRFLDVRREARTLADVAAFAERTAPVGDGGTVQERPIAAVSASYFRFFDARPVRGRFFAESEDTTPRGADVVVLGHDYWRTHFGSGEVVGRMLKVGNIRATIVGVAPDGFDGLNDGRPPAVFVPITTYAASTGTGDARTYFSAYKWGWVQLLVRRAKGIDLATATADTTRIFKDAWPRFVADNPHLPSVEAADPKVVLAGLRIGAGPSAGREARTALWLFGLASAVLLIGCANVANLSVSRTLARRRDVSVRLALGITTRRLVIGSYAEAALLALGGGLVALMIAQGTRSALAPVLRTLRLTEVSVFSDQRMLAVTAVLVVISAVVIGWVPSVFLRRAHVNGLQARTSRITADGRQTRLLLLATQTMLSVVLLIGAGLFLRSLLAVQFSSLGYDTSRVLLVTRHIPPGGFEVAQQVAIREQLLQTAAALPEVESAAWMSSAPFVSTSDTDIHVAGLPNATALGPFTFQATTASYFNTMGTRIVQGRSLRDDDTLGAPAVAVVSESMARTLWPGRNPLGECFRMRTVDSPCRLVVGVAEDIVQRELAGGRRLHYYVPIDQYPSTFGNGLLIKLRDEPGQTGERVRAALQRALPAGYYLVAQPLADVVVDQHASWRMGASVLIAFGILAMVVAGVGLFGSLSYDIAQRSREWAVRVALGANRSAIVGLIVGRSLTDVLIGVVPGLLLAAISGRWIQPLLYQTSALDPMSFAVATILMFLVAFAASTWPALTAARTHPNQALRSE